MKESEADNKPYFRSTTFITPNFTRFLHIQNSCDKLLTANGMVCGSKLTMRNKRQCIKWKDSSSRIDPIPDFRTFCKKYDNDNYCTVPNSQDFCQTINCSFKAKVEICNANILWSSNSSSIMLYFRNNFNMTDLIVLYHDDNIGCTVFKVCRECNATKLIFNKYFKFCTELQAARNYPNIAVYNKIMPNKLHTFFLIPIVNGNSIGPVSRLSLKTKVTNLVPRSPTGLKIINKTSTTITLQWSLNENDIAVRIADRYQITISDFTFTDRTYSIQTAREVVFVKDLKPCRIYLIIMKATMNSSESITLHTLNTNTNAVFGKLRLLSIPSHLSHSRLIRWEYNDAFNCPITFRVQYQQTHHANGYQIIETNKTFANLNNLKANQLYEVQISLMWNSQVRGYSLKKHFYNKNIIQIVHNLQIKNQNKSLYISWNLESDSSVENVMYLLMLKTSQRRCLHLITINCINCISLLDGEELNLITAEAACDTATNQSFLVNKSNFSVNLYTNQIVDSGTITLYAGNILGFQIIGTKHLNYNDEKVYCYLLLAFSIIILALAIGFAAYRRELLCIHLKSKRFGKAIESQTCHNQSDNLKENNIDSEEPIDEFISEFQDLYTISVNLSDTFQAFDLENIDKRIGGLRESCSTLYRPKMSMLDIHLECPNLNVQFISFLDNANELEYIICEDPLNEDLDTFFHLIMHQSVSLMLMMTSDRISSLPYWEQTQIQIHNFNMDRSPFLISLNAEKVKSEYTERILSITDKKSDEERVITHIEIHNWNAFSTPNHGNFDKVILRCHEWKEAGISPPYLVHANSGISGIGAFIVVDRIIGNILNNFHEVNIFYEISQIKKNRCPMLQHQAQYIYIQEFIEYFAKKYLKTISFV